VAVPLLNRPLPRVRLLCALDGAHVLPIATVGQAVIGGAGDRIGAEGAGEVRGLEHDTGLGIKGDRAMQLGDAFLGRLELLGG
jgi:hypothetical protein